MGVSLVIWRAAIGLFTHGLCTSTKTSRKHGASTWNGRTLPVLVVILVLLIIGNVERNPGPFPCKFKSCEVVTDTIAANVRHQQYHSSNSNFIFSCPSPGCISVTKSFSSLNNHVSTFHRDTAHDIVGDNPEVAKLSCSVENCPFTTDSLRTLVQHKCSHLDKSEDVLCPVKLCKFASKFHKASTFRVHLSQYHPGWNDEGCPRGKKRARENESRNPPPEKRRTTDDCTTSTFEVQGSLGEDAVREENSEDSELLSDNLIVDKIGKFYLQLYGEHFVPYDTIQEISEGLSFITGVNNLRMNSVLRAGLKTLGVDQVHVNELCYKVFMADSLFTTHHKAAPGPSFTSDYLRKLFFKLNYNFIAPIEVDLSGGTNPDHKLQYVSIEDTLSTIFNDPAVQKDVQDSFVRRPSDTNEVSDYTSGSLFKDENHQPEELHLHMYQDAYNPVMNALGSAKNKYKALGVYFTLGNLEAKKRSKVNSKYLVMLIRESVFKELGQEVCFKTLMAELKKLENVGVIYKGKRIKVLVQFFLGDNLGQHTIGGFLESFTCEFFCRFCDIRRPDFKANPEKINPARTKEDYEECVRQAATKESHRGIKGDCVFNKLKNFHAVSHTVSCIAHDLFEGVVSWDLTGIIRSFVTKKWFTYDLLNKRIKKFKCKGIDQPNKPAFVKFQTKSKRQSKVLGGHAVQNWSLLRLLPFLIGDKIKDFNDPAYKLYLLLKKICEYFCSHSFLKTDVPYIKDVLLPLYFQQRPEVLDERKYPYKPKHHYWNHFCEKLLAWGPLIHLWTMPFEQKHKLFKTIARQSRSFHNIEHTCATRHQFNLAYLATGPLFPEGCIEVKSSELRIDSKQGNLKNYLQTLPIVKKNCRECEAVDLDGISYSLGDLILLSSNNSDIDSGWIRMIICVENEVYFVLECITAMFNHTVGIYEVPQDASGDLSCIPARSLKYPQPQPLYNFKGKLGFSVKGKII